MDLGFNLAQSNQDLKDPTSRQIFGDTSGLLCKNDPILRHIQPFLISTFMLSCVCMKDSPRSDELLYVNDHGLYYYILT